MSKKNQIFTQTPIRKPNRNLFDLSHEVKMSGQFGYLYPMLIKECLPGDTWRNDTSVFMRMAPMLSPVMHRIDVTTHYFFVPNRLLWDSWEDFITGGQDGTFTAVPPYVTVAAIADGGAAFGVGSLWDYMGLPVAPNSGTATSTIPISALPFYAYAKVFNDYYVDPNLGDEIEFDTALDGNVSTTFISNELYVLRRRGWEKDYFTANLPFAQRGTEVLMPISGVAEDADIEYKNLSTIHYSDGSLATGSPLSALTGAINTPTNSTRIENLESVTINNTTTTINDFRRSMALQRWLEVNARSGHRYNEQIFGHFAVRVPDYRLQRAEYLGGGKQPVVISEVLSTAESEDVPVGDLFGHGVSVGKSNHFSYYAQEHGFIIGIISIMPRTAYASQGIERMWSRADKLDYAWPEFANIGEQETLNKEIFFNPFVAGDAANNGTFGYLPRYSEYKFSNDRVAGDFRTTLAFWHEARIFNAAPSLDVDFTTMRENGGGGSDEETYRRIFAVQDGTDYLWMQLFHNLKAKRPLPYFGVPSI